MTASDVISEIRKKLLIEIESLKTIASGAHAAATDGELRAEGKYDTQAIEAGYLAGAQKARLDQLQQDLAKLDTLRSPIGRVVGAGSLFEVEDRGLYFLSPIAGGQTLKIGPKEVTVLSISSPIGRELLDLEPGDSVEIQRPDGAEEFTIGTLLN